MGNNWCVFSFALYLVPQWTRVPSSERTITLSLPLGDAVSPGVDITTGSTGTRSGGARQAASGKRRAADLGLAVSELVAQGKAVMEQAQERASKSARRPDQSKLERASDVAQADGFTDEKVVQLSEIFENDKKASGFVVLKTPQLRRMYVMRQLARSGQQVFSGGGSTYVSMLDLAVFNGMGGYGLGHLQNYAAMGGDG